MKRWLILQGWWDEEQDETLKQQHRQTVVDAMKKGEKVSPPALDDLFTDVYDSLPWNLEEQKAALEEHIRRYPESYKKSSWRFGHE